MRCVQLSFLALGGCGCRSNDLRQEPGYMWRWIQISLKIFVDVTIQIGAYWCDKINEMKKMYSWQTSMNFDYFFSSNPHCLGLADKRSQSVDLVPWTRKLQVWWVWIQLRDLLFHQHNQEFLGKRVSLGTADKSNRWLNCCKSRLSVVNDESSSKKPRWIISRFEQLVMTEDYQVLCAISQCVLEVFWSTHWKLWRYRTGLVESSQFHRI